MAVDMVMRSVFLPPAEDAKLRQLAFDLNVSKSDLIRSAISLKLQDWLRGDKPGLVLKDLKAGRRDEIKARQRDNDTDGRNVSAGMDAPKKRQAAATPARSRRTTSGR